MVEAFQVLGVLAVIGIPIALLVLLFTYLRRAAPGGVVPAPTSAPSPPAEEAPSRVQGPGARVTGARTCAKCGFTTTAAMIGGMVPRCQNCNAALPPA